MNTLQVATALRIDQLGIKQPDAEQVATLSRALINPVTNAVVAYVGLSGGLVTVGAAGDVISVNATEATEAANGAFLAAAKAAASSGDTVVVGPGSYAISASIAKSGVNWHFDAGANVSLTLDSDSPGAAIFDDGGTAMTFSVTGAGNFSRINAGDGDAVVVRSSHASSIILFEANDISASGSLSASGAVWCAAGQLYVKARRITASNSSSGAYWTNGSLHVMASVIDASVSNGTAAVYSHVNATPTGDCYVQADELVGGNSGPVYAAGSNTVAALWVNALVVRGIAEGISAGIVHAGTERVYVTCQKLFGNILLSGTGLLYVRTLKHAAIADGATGAANFIYATAAGTLRYSCPHLDPVTFIGESVKVTTGTVLIEQANLTAIASGKGFEVTGGTLTLANTKINTAANASTSPITKSGGTLVVGSDCILLTNSGSTSISAPTAQNVVNYGYWANYAKDADVTLKVVTTENVSADVA